MARRTGKTGRLTYEDRVYIEKHCDENAKSASVKEIAEHLGRSETTIWRELKRAGTPYSARRAQEATEWALGARSRLREERERERVEKIKAALKENPTLKIADFMRMFGYSRPIATESCKKAILELYEESVKLDEADK